MSESGKGQLKIAVAGASGRMGKMLIEAIGAAPETVLATPGLEDPCPFWDDDGSAYLVHSRKGLGECKLDLETRPLHATLSSIRHGGKRRASPAL